MKAAPKLVAAPGIDMEAAINHLDGDQIVEQEVLDSEGNVVKKGGHKVVLRDLCINGLLAADTTATEKDKLDRFMLAMLVNKKRHPKLRAADLKLLMSRISAIYPPLLVGRAAELLDPNSLPEMESGE